MTFSDKLKTARAEADLTLREVADLVGAYGRVTVWRWEDGRRTPEPIKQQVILERIKESSN